MSVFTTDIRRMSTGVGCLILAATTNATIIKTGGYFSANALLIASLSIGVFAGACVIGAGTAGKIGLVILAALVAGEAFNLSSTAERIVTDRETLASPLKGALVKHTQLVNKLHKLADMGNPITPRIDLAKQTKASADAAYDKELREGGRCKTICEGLRADADKAQAEVIAALQEAEQGHQAQIKAAQAEVAANPLPASATPLADRLGVPPWALDLFMAALLSIGANGLAGTLIAYGAHSGEPIETAADDRCVPVEVPGSTAPTKPRKRKRFSTARSEPQIRANEIAAELRGSGKVVKFSTVRSEYQRRFGESLPKVTAHRAVG